MRILRAIAAGALIATTAVPALAQSDQETEYRNAVSLFITLQGYPCGSVLTVEQREEPNAFNVTCALAADGSGEQVTYFFQLEGGGAIVKPL